MQTYTLKDLTNLLTKESQQLSKKPSIFRKLTAGLLLMGSDLLMISVAILLSVVIRNLVFDLPLFENISIYLNVLPLIAIMFSVGFYFRNMYPGYGLDVIEELRIIFYTNTFIYGLLASSTFFINDIWEYSRLAFLLSWAFTFTFIPLGRSYLRKVCSDKNWWGIPVIIIGAGKSGEELINSLDKHKKIGLRPVIAVDDNIDRWGYIKGIPVVGGLDIIPELQRKLKIEHSIIAMPKVPSKRQKEIILKYSKYFENTTVIPDLFGVSTLWVSTKEIGGILGLEVKQKLLKKSSYFKKRLFDIILASILFLITLPVNLFLSLMIKLDSKGKVLFKQTRMGLNDSRFKIIKFRTMHTDAEERLDELLENDKELKAEFEIYHKLNDDPRLTKVGKFLRKFSMDELPQFWNVLKGEMSLIGPRAYIPWEKIKMNGYDEIILKVKPGISGLWQVTDRNNSSFEERNMIDVYYIRNWSMFLDLYILARTISVVITGKGG